MSNFNRNSGTSRDRFDREGSGRFGRRNSNKSYRHDSRESEFYEVICDKCGKKCEVPFHPTEGKPVYCSDCFKGSDRSESKNVPASNQFEKEFDQINEKLNKILKTLKIE